MIYSSTNRFIKNMNPPRRLTHQLHIEANKLNADIRSIANSFPPSTAEWLPAYKALIAEGLSKETAFLLCERFGILSLTQGLSVEFSSQEYDYSPECSACLRGLNHSSEQHLGSIKRSLSS